MKGYSRRGSANNLREAGDYEVPRGPSPRGCLAWLLREKRRQSIRIRKHRGPPNTASEHREPRAQQP